MLPYAQQLSPAKTVIHVGHCSSATVRTDALEDDVMIGEAESMGVFNQAV